MNNLVKRNMKQCAKLGKLVKILHDFCCSVFSMSQTPNIKHMTHHYLVVVVAVGTVSCSLYIYYVNTYTVISTYTHYFMSCHAFFSVFYI